MNIVLILIPVSLVLGGLGLAAFLWSINSDQYQDLEGDAARALSEE